MARVRVERSYRNRGVHASVVIGILELGYTSCWPIEAFAVVLRFMKYRQS